MTTPTRPRAIELVALTPVALPLAGLCLLSVIGVLLLTGQRGRKVASGVAVLALLAIAMTGSWIAPLFVGDRPAAEGDGSLIIMAQNLEHGDAQTIAEAALNSGVDVLVVTEASAQSVLELQSGKLGRHLCYDVGLDQSGPSGTVAFSRFPLTELARISDGGDSRVVKVHSPTMGDVDVVALHPTPPYQEGAWTADYERITTHLRNRYASSTSLVKQPVIIAGDFNATLDHMPLRGIQALGFSDAVDQLNLGFQPTWPAPGSVQRAGFSVPPFVQIDHILTSSALVVVKLASLHPGGTDHLGVLAEVRRARS
jgi:endonuclease/exonuclease/phosphatase (EEP) superfamily protein YafD